jgi:hypothetical protein
LGIDTSFLLFKGTKGAGTVGSVNGETHQCVSSFPLLAKAATHTTLNR